MRRANLSKGVAALLLPLSAVPIAMAAPQMVDDYESYRATYVDREPLPAPTNVLTRSEQAAFSRTGRPHRGIPVLVYHGLDASDDPFAVRPRSFARQMAMLDRAGFQTVSAEQYAKALAGEPVDLPERPVLVTFDDGLKSSYRVADRILERHGFRATMFVITERAGATTESFLRWDELRTMAGGRWDVQLHAGAGHEQVPSGPHGRSGPAYANRVYADGRLESRPAAYDRITTDLAKGAEQLREQLPETRTWTFSVPFGSFGADGEGNDRRLARQVGGWLKQRYVATFVQRDRPRPAGPGDAHRVVERREVRSDTSTASLHRWLCLCTQTKEDRS